MPRFIAVLISLSALLFASSPADADEIRLLASVGIKTVVDELVPRFEQSSPHKVVRVFDLAATLKTRIEKGEAFDVAILTPPLIDDLIARKIIAPDSKTAIARVGLGLMIRAGAAKPDVRTVDAFVRTLLAARGIAYAPAGASGVAFLATAAKLDIADRIKPLARPVASGDDVAAAVVTGAADLGVLPVSEILPIAGAELGGVFPPDVQTYIVMAAGMHARTTQAAAVRDLVAFLTSPANAAVIRQKGMETAR